MNSTASRAALARGSRYARASARSAPWLHARDQEPELIHLHFSEPLRRIRDEQHGLASFARLWRSRLSLRSSIDQIYTPATRPRSRARGASAAAITKPSQDAPSSPHPSPPTRLIQPAATLG